MPPGSAESAADGRLPEATDGRTDRSVNTDELAALCERIGNEQLEIRLCCPRGHLIVAVAVGVVSFGGELMLVMAPAVGRDHSWSRRLIGDKHELAGNPGFTVNDDPHRPGLLRPARSSSHDPFGRTVTLSCRRCRQQSVRDYQRLAVELAVYALAGHREHKLSF